MARVNFGVGAAAEGFPGPRVLGGEGEVSARLRGLNGGAREGRVAGVAGDFVEHLRGGDVLAAGGAQTCVQRVLKDERVFRPVGRGRGEGARRMRKNENGAQGEGDSGEFLQHENCAEAVRWPRTESNRRHKDFQSSALPTELLGRMVLKGVLFSESGLGVLGWELGGVGS